MLALAVIAFSGPLSSPAWASPQTPDSTVPVEGSSTQTFRLADGNSVAVNASGVGQVSDAHGVTQQFLTTPVQGDSAEGPLRPNRNAIAQKLASDHRGSTAPGSLIVAFKQAVLTGAPMSRQSAVRAPLTSDAAVNRTLRAVHATSISPLLGAAPTEQVKALAQAARQQLGPSALDLSRVDVVHLSGQDTLTAVAHLRSTPGVAYVEPDFYVDPMDVPPTPMPAMPTLRHPVAPPRAAADKPDLPTNFGLQSSLQTFLNANGVNAVGAYARLQSGYGQLPGQGEIITNVSTGDLISTDMSRSGKDPYASQVGPTTVRDGEQRYLDLPSMPLIPTFTASASGHLDPLGTTEYQDPTLSEVMLDFGVMAPLPHDKQRPRQVGANATDLLGIAPGANYRLVVPQQPSASQIASTILAAANQNPRPDVINVSLGYASDSVGFPGRYLEDDPVQQAVVAAVVHQYGIVMSIAVNDGTRLITPAAVGPDGGSTPTDLARRGETPTSVADDYDSSTPSRVVDSGAIAVGGTTTDDTIAAHLQATGPNARSGTFAETRISGATSFSSGFGNRVNVSAPSDAIPSFIHPFVGGFGPPQAVTPVLSGGTSASAPMTAAAAAVVLQTARLSGQHLDPLQVRDLLQRTGRAVPTPPQIDRPLNVGPQIDVTAAVNALLPRNAPAAPSIVRVSVAHRQELGGLDGTFMEATDPSNIHLDGDSGQDLFEPITFAADLTGQLPRNNLRYRLKVGSNDFDTSRPSVRLTPAELLTAAHQPVVSTTARTVPVAFQIVHQNVVIAQYEMRVGFSPSSGTHPEALAPVAPSVARAGQDVPVHYDLTGVTNLNKPELVVSTVGHWSPAAAPAFHIAYAVPLTQTMGAIRLPARAFTNGGGIYGIGIAQDSTGALPLWGRFTPIRVDGGSLSTRPQAPLLAAGGNGGHLVTVTRAHPQFHVTYDVSRVPGATGAALEVSAPAPTLYGSLSTFSNPNGTVRDNNGIDTGSAVDQPLRGVKGRAGFNALAMGLSTSLGYSVRVIPVGRDGRPVGQASPSSFLALNDGLLPDGELLEDFAMAGRNATTVSTYSRTPGVIGITDSTVRRYDPTTGTYAPPLAEDPQGHTLYETYGSDPALGRTVIGARSYPDSTHPGFAQSVQSYDLASGAKVADVSVEPQQFDLQAGQVDPQHHRATMLTWHYPEATSDVLTFDIATGTAQDPISVDPVGAKPGLYRSMDIDTATGRAVLSSGVPSGECMRGTRPSNFVTVDPASRAVSNVGTTSTCAVGVASGKNGHDAYVLSGPYGGILGRALDGTIIPVDETTTQVRPSIDIASTPNVLFPTVDPVHHLMLVASPFGNDLCANMAHGLGCEWNNNPMSSIAVVNLTTGKTIERLPDFSLLGATQAPVHDDNFTDKHMIQIDPSTRTAWTYGPGGHQLQQFTY